MQYYLAIDIGASSGRHILGHVEDGRLVLEEIYRFDNRQIHKNGHDCWDLENLWEGIIGGLKACGEIGKIPATVGIDTWAVDYILLDEQDRMIGDAVAYRDGRTAGMREVVNELIPAEKLYERTGIQYQPFNTIYQLTALKREHPEQLKKAKWFLMIPEYYNFRLTGIKQNEYTNATSTNLVGAEAKTWDASVIEELELPVELFHDLAMPGTVLGNLLPEIREQLGFDTTVILPATHDTGSAFLAIPARDDEAVYISSGTWSLLGVENEHPITTKESQAQNFTNEGGAWYRYRYLKNIMGLWMIQSIRRELNGAVYVQGKMVAGKTKSNGDEDSDSDKEDLSVNGKSVRLSGADGQQAAAKKWTFPALIAAARATEGFQSIVDVNRDCFLAPESMIRAIKDECARTSQPVPETVGEIMQCVYTSLSLCYRDAIKSLEQLTGKKYTSINIVGGGCQDTYLNERTAKATGLPVYAGPVEGTAIGNLIIQMIAGGDISDLQAAREMIRQSFAVTVVQP
ncbi:MAG: rhamnulokinase [Lachnospiraceae bacterium]|nr:rhamnulokinase [Lachnospiraceae bacterium]